MPRLVNFRLVVPRGVCLVIAAGTMLSGGAAMAQVAGTFSNPLSPQLDFPSAFQKLDNRALAPSSQPMTFTLPPSGAGSTGFDTSNAPTRAPARRHSATALATTALEPIPANDALDTAPPAAPSPYQAPIPPLPGDGVAAAPPVVLGPIRRPPLKRRAHPDEPTDPFAPAGIRAGAFLLYPSLELIGGYDSNPGAVPGGKGAALYTVSPELQVQSDWSRHELRADLRGSYIGYSPNQTPTLSRPYFNGTVDGRIDVTHATHINLGSQLLVSTDNPGSPNLQAGLAKLPVFVTYGGSAGVSHVFNRLELTATAAAQRTSYQDSTLTDGTSVSNTDRNYNQIGGALRAGYETMPGVKPFVQIQADKRVHDTQYDAYGYERDSKGVGGLLGSTFALKRDLTGEIAIGYARRTYADPRLAPIEGVIGNASLTWNADALNTVRLSANSTIAESTIQGVSGVLSRDLGVQFDHAFRRWLIGSLKFGFGWDIYQGTVVATSNGSTPTVQLCPCVISNPGSSSSGGGVSADRIDKRYSAGLGLTYKFSRDLWFNGEFRQDWLRSNVSGVGYTASTVLVGARLQR